MTITVETHCYGPLSDDNYRSVDLYFPVQADRDSCLLVFIHGGAWRSEDKADYKDLCTGFCELGYSVASVNYRLSLKENSQDIPLIQHPNHIHDVGKAITYLHNKYQKPIYLVGHSAGAHIALMLLLDTQLRYHSYVHGVLGVSGIYDIPLLVKTYPSYLEFITQAFGHDHNRYFDASPVSKVSEALDHKPIVIAQSPADSLVNNEQAEVMYRHIKGFHENVILDMSLKGDHYEIMNTENLIDAVKQMLNA